jgi:hypothetical protein
LVPVRYLSTYLPRTPPEKSYSGLILTRLRLEFGFFVDVFFMFCGNPSADRPDSFSPDSMNHYLCFAR